MNRWMSVVAAAGAVLALSAALSAPAAQASPAGVARPASSGIFEPADCSTSFTESFGTVNYSMTCSARPAGQQWQEVMYCNPRGADGTDYVYAGTIATGDGTSAHAVCDLLNDSGYYDLEFSDSGLLAPGRYPNESAFPR